MRDEEAATAAPASGAGFLSALWGRKTSAAVAVARLLCPIEHVKDRLVEVFGLVGKNIMSCASDHLGRHRVVQ